MKILIINDSYQEIGGVDSHIKLLIKYLQSKNNEVFSLYLSNDMDMENNKEKIINYKFNNKLQWFISENLINFNLYNKIRKYILKINPDIIHFQNNHRATKTLLLATRGYKTIQTIHDYKPVCPLTTMVIEKDNYAICAGKNKIKCYKKRCLKLQTNLFDFFIFDNNFWQKKYINEFICPSKLLMSKLKEYDYNNLIYLPNPIETLKEQETNIKSNNILFVGRLIKEKGVKYLIDGFKIAISKNNNLRLIIVGTGPEKDYLEKYCKDLNIEEFINFAGNIEPNKIDTYYKNSLAVIIPSILMEQFGLTALEGMKNGRPIIAFNIGGLTELIENGRNGFLINRFDSQKLAEKIILLSNDRYLAEKMGQVGLEKMKKYEIKNYSNEMIKIYQSN